MSVQNFGDYNTTETVNIPFNTFDSNDPTQSVTVTDLVAADIEIHKDGAVAQRTSDNGVTVSINFDGVTGNHMIHIDLSDNSDAGFYSAGSRYAVRIEGVTVDAGTLNSWVGFFSIGCVLRPSTDGNTLDVSSTGEAGLDFDNIKDATGAHTLTNITVPVVTVNSDMRGTDNAALASVLGALADVAADGDPTNAETVMQYVKQLINILVGSVGIPAFPAEAAPGNNVSLAEVIRAIHVDVTGLNGAAMRGTDGANTTTPDAAGTAAALHATTDALIAALNNLSSAQAQTACDAALVAIHLDHLFGVDYDPASKPGVATALLNELVENDGGVSRFSENTLEQGRGTNNAATAGDLMNLADDAITSAKYDESTAYPIKSADSGATQIARVGADGDTLETLSDQLDTITTHLTQIKGGVWTDENLTTIDANMDTLIARLSAVRAGYLDNLSAGAVALEATLTAMKGATFNEATDSLEAIRNRGDIAWITGGGGDATEANQDLILDHLEDIEGVAFDPDTDSLEAIRNRGDAAWLTGGGVGGASTITFTIQESGPIPIPDASVQIWNTGLTVLISYAVTDSNGQVQVTANDGDYKVKVRKAGFSFADPFDLTVSGNTSKTYTGMDYSPSAPANPSICRVYEYLYDAVGSPMATEPENLASIIELPYDDGSILYAGATINGTYDSSTGLLYWDIVQGSKAAFVIRDYNVDLTKTIPVLDTVRLSDIT